MEKIYTDEIDALLLEKAKTDEVIRLADEAEWKIERAKIEKFIRIRDTFIYSIFEKFGNMLSKKGIKYYINKYDNLYSEDPGVELASIRFSFTAVNGYSRELDDSYPCFLHVYLSKVNDDINFNKSTVDIGEPGKGETDGSCTYEQLDEDLILEKLMNVFRLALSQNNYEKGNFLRFSLLNVSK